MDNLRLIRLLLPLCVSRLSVPSWQGRPIVKKACLLCCQRTSSTRTWFCISWACAVAQKGKVVAVSSCSYQSLHLLDNDRDGIKDVSLRHTPSPFHRWFWILFWTQAIFITCFFLQTESATSEAKSAQTTSDDEEINTSSSSLKRTSNDGESLNLKRRVSYLTMLIPPRIFPKCLGEL